MDSTVAHREGPTWCIRVAVGENLTIKPQGWDTLHKREDVELANLVDNDSESNGIIGVEDLLNHRDVEVAPNGAGQAWTKVN